MTQRYRPVPPITEDMPAIREAVDALRERTEVQSRERGNVEQSFVSVQDLIDLGLITAVQARSLS